MMEWQLNPIDMVRLRGRPCGEAPVATLEVKRQAEGVAERFGGEHLVDRARGAHLPSRINSTWVKLGGISSG